MFPRLTCCLAILFAAGFAFADEVSTRPDVGLRENVPTLTALTGATVVVSPEKRIRNTTIVVKDGRIVAVGEDAKPPAGARVIRMAGKTIYPAFIDGYSEIDTDVQTDGAPYWNEDVQAQRRVAAVYKADSDRNASLRKQGFAARLAAPDDGVIRGQSAVVSTGDEDAPRAVLRSDVAQHIRLTVGRGRGREHFPNSPMGAVALARQTMIDAAWHRDAWKAFSHNNALPRPEVNDALDSLQPVINHNALVIVDALNEQYALRADIFAKEFDLNIALRGSGREYRRLDAIADTGRPIIVPLNFPKPPNVATAEAAMNVSLAEMMHWDIAPENPSRLVKAGVEIVLTTDRLDKVSRFLPAVRKAISRGLSPSDALAALTSTPAQLYGVDDELGSIEPGKAASFIVCDGAMFAEKTKVLETWVAGERFRFDEDPADEIAGTWSGEFQRGDNARSISLNIEDGKSGELIVPGTKKGIETKIELANVGYAAGRFSATFDGKDLGQKGYAQLTGVLLEGKSLTGSIVWADGSTSTFQTTRGKAVRTATKKGGSAEKPVRASYPVNYPFGSCGLLASPNQPRRVLFTNAAVWTCGPEGVLENVDVLIGGGVILQIGENLNPGPGVLTVDAKGMHISPGIIDCHSHMATDGGINESTQAVTAEVRIGDFIDANDINIYRQLAGGVTTSNILHGSANPIGGQNQVIKLRWGALPEAMKFAEAPQGIKFALGENVKQSNWGDEYTTRYPQTRMGVVEIMKDELQAAKEYAAEHARWRKNPVGLPPRRDLELDAISEILTGERWIHCHSYRQDEILALIRTLDEYDVTIGTFQHILEGYKVADAMAKHGAMGSSFADWWTYKFEVYDAIPFNGALMHEQGVVVSFNSDDRELARHLNQEAAKAVKYGKVDPVEALKFVTINPAKQLRIEKHTGSLEIGKHADLVLWSDSPLSNYARCEQTWVDGRKYFDRAADRKQRDDERSMRLTLIQKILNSGETMKKPGERDIDPAELWPREDTFCGHHDHGHGHDH